MASVSRKRPPLSVNTFLANHNDDGRASNNKLSGKETHSDSKQEKLSNNSPIEPKHESNDFSVRLFDDNNPHNKALERLYLQAYYGPGSPGSPKQHTQSPPSTPDHQQYRPTGSVSSHLIPEESPSLCDSAEITKPMIKLRKPTSDHVPNPEDSCSTRGNVANIMVALSDQSDEIPTRVHKSEFEVANLQDDRSKGNPISEGIVKVAAQGSALTAGESSKSTSAIKTPLRFLPRRIFTKSHSSSPTNSAVIMKMPRKSVGSGSSRSTSGNQTSSDYDFRCSPSSSLESSPSSDVPSMPVDSQSGSPSKEENRGWSRKHEAYAIQKVGVYLLDYLYHC